MLGLTLQQSLKYTKRVKVKLCEANQCLYILRALRKDGYTQDAIDHLFKAIVLPKFMYALPVYGASSSDVNLIWYNGFLLDVIKDAIFLSALMLMKSHRKLIESYLRKLKRTLQVPFMTCCQ